MTVISKRAIERVVGLLAGPGGLGDNLDAVAETEGVARTELPDCEVVALNTGTEFLERRGEGRYPSASVRCESLSNALTEKFRQFSGKARMCIDVRVTHDHAARAEGLLHLYTAAVLRTLDQQRGDWGEGLFYSGGYEVDFPALKPGGKRYVHTATVRMTIDVSV